MSKYIEGAPIEIGGTTYPLKWTLRNLKWMKQLYGLTMEKVNFMDPDECVPFLLAGLRQSAPELKEDDILDGVDIVALLRFGEEFSKIQEEVTAPLGDTTNSGPSAE